MQQFSAVSRIIFFLALANSLMIEDVLACDLCAGFGCSYCHAAQWQVEQTAIPYSMSRPEHRHLTMAAGDDPADALDPPGTLGSGEASVNYAIQGGKWPQAHRGDPVTITYSYNNMFDGRLKGPDGNPLSVDLIRSSIEEALSLWAGVAPLHFVEVEDEGTPVPITTYPDGQYGQIRFHHRYINGPDVPGEQPQAKAIAYYPSNGGKVAGDVFFDHGDPWQEVGTLSEPDILGAAVHEIGHTLGLGHSTVADANMYWIFTRTAGLGTASLHPDDIAGVRAIYGIGVGSVTPLLAVPEPAIPCASLIAVLLWGGVRRRAGHTFRIRGRLARYSERVTM